MAEGASVSEAKCISSDKEAGSRQRIDNHESDDEDDECKDVAATFNKEITLDENFQGKILQWRKEQEKLKALLQQEDSDDVKIWSLDFSNLHYVAGVDISFEKANPNHACATLAVLSFPEMKVLEECSKIVEMTEPYIPGFLAFREATHLLERLKDLECNHPHLKPQVILVDGNGILHPDGFGYACHLGVLSSIPCIGVAKKLFLVDGLQNDTSHKDKIRTELKKKGDYFELNGTSGDVLATVVRTSDNATKPVYVSIGHKISLEVATRLTIACSKKRVPEPIRMADLLSRRHLREKKKPQKQKCKVQE